LRLSKIFLSGRALIVAGLMIFSLFCTKTGVVDSQAENETDRKAESSTFPGLTGKIVFQSNRDGDEEVFVMDSQGNGLTQLTDNSAFDGYPVWSKAGDKICFESNRSGTFQIYIMDEDGENQIQVTTGTFDNRYPSWSPDGKRIAYESKRKNREQIYEIDLESRKESGLSRNWYRSGLPNWSPDGKTIAFTANKFLGWGVYLMDRDGSNVRALDTEGGSCRPHWSKDGQKIAYVSAKADDKGDIWIMNPDGTGKHRLTTDSLNYDYYPSWSADGNWIVYASTSHKQKGNWEIRIIRVSSGESVQITDHPAQDQYPDWKD